MADLPQVQSVESEAAEARGATFRAEDGEEALKPLSTHTEGSTDVDHDELAGTRPIEVPSDEESEPPRDDGSLAVEAIHTSENGEATEVNEPLAEAESVTGASLKESNVQQEQT
jgi:hypothetical protein